jgi:hypothetical protein
MLGSKLLGCTVGGSGVEHLIAFVDFMCILER